MEAAEVVDFLLEFAPVELALKWDKVGLIKDTCELVKVVVLTNDLTNAVIDEAVAKKANMIITYHPPITGPHNQRSWKSDLMQKLADNKIALYCPHSTWDTVVGGVTDWLADAFKDFPSTKSFITKIPSTTLKAAGTGRLLRLHTPITLTAAVAAVKSHCSLSHIRIGESFTSEIKRIVIHAGSPGAQQWKNFDLIVTGELSHHHILEAVEAGCHVILCEHSNSERGFLNEFQSILSDKFPSISVVVSTVDKDPITIV